MMLASKRRYSKHMALPRIAALQPSISIVLQRLDRLDALVACTRYCIEAIPELAGRDVAVIADSWSTSAEEILAVSPDLVIASVPYRQESLTAILKASRPVLALAPRSLADIDADIRLLGSLVQASAQAEALIELMAAEREAIRIRAVATGHRPLIYCEEWGKPLIHSQLWVRELVELAGGRFLGEPGATTDAATVAAANPDVLAFAWCGAGDRVPLQRVIDQRQWQHLPAAQNSRVYCIPDEWLNTPAPTLLDGLRALAAALHPECFVTPSNVRQLANAVTI
ncbi:MAG TPA: ABC transporter substrate-binding protein [Acidobacteriaceae bacterium]|nr:ABC transporter substrate-binding protein [Acidobacteriaceae bacterium]